MNPAGSGDTRVKQRLKTRDQFLDYAKRVTGRIELTAKHGIRPISESKSNDPHVKSGREGDIGLACLDDDLMFYRVGHHRIGAAIGLSIERIPCQCYFISSSVSQSTDLSELQQATIAKLEALQGNKA